MTNQAAEGETSVGGACTMAVRSMLHLACQRSWRVGSIDVTGAFLQAPRRKSSCVTVTEPPSLLRAMGLTEAGEKWKVNCALYGFVESPADWSAFRDASLRKATWVWQGKLHRFQASKEPHVWKLVDQHDHVVGLMAIYVDDMLVAAEDGNLQEAFGALKRSWNCSPEEYVSKERPMRFCGYEIVELEEEQLHIGQGSYIRDLLERHGVQGVEKTPIPAISDEEDEEPIDYKEVKAAQQVIGELQWLVGRSRPDLAYGVGVLARLIHRRPKYVNQLAGHMMRYLNDTKDLGLIYKKEDDDEIEVTAFGERRNPRRIDIFCDGSFAPPHEKFRGVHGVVVEQLHGKSASLAIGQTTIHCSEHGGK